VVGQRLSHYRILEQIGSGGMGVVYRALDERLQRDVAIKVLPPGLLLQESARRRFRREAHALSRISHPQISTILDFDTDAGCDFLVLEYVLGVTLAKKLESGPLPLAELVDVGRQIARGLEDAHERGIVHRDLKPANVMVTPKGWIKILDFGVAKLTEEADEASLHQLSLTDSNAVVGTIPYMAPEQLQGQPVDGRTDLHALGAILYEAATGARAFGGETVGGLMEAILHRQPPPPSTLRPELSPEFDSLIARALEKDPARRFSSAGDMDRALEALGPTGATGTGASAGGARRVRRRALQIAMGAALLAGLLVFPLGGVRFVLDRLGSEPQYDGIAILPLQNLSGDPAEDFFAEGMTDAITTQLAQVGSLRVISRSSSAAALKAGGGPREIARRLGVDILVEGTVVRSSKRLRVSAKLVDAARERYVWAESYERDQGDVLALQGEMALAIAQQIRSRLSPHEESRLSEGGSVRPDAYEAYLRGRHFWSRRTKEGLETAVGHFQRAIDIDPHYAAAHAGLADAYAVFDIYTGARPTWSFPRAREAALQAIKLDSSLADAHASLARVLLHYEWNFPEAEREFRRAIVLNPGYATAHHWYSIYLRDVGRFGEAIAEAEKARSLDPLSLIINANLGDAYFYARRFDKAVAQLQETSRLDSTFAPAHLYLGNALEQLGRHREGFASIERARALSGDSAYGLGPLGFVAGRKGDRPLARSIVASLTALHREGRARALDVALAHLGLGEGKRAMEWLERAYDERSGLNDLAVDPRFDALRGESPFRELLRRVGLQPEVVAHP